MAQMELKISVCIITRDRLDALKRCLDCLRAQLCRPHEIIVVDNSTTSETTDYLNKCRPEVIVVRVNGPVGCQPKMRNAGIAKASGEIVCFLDDDGFADPAWLQELIPAFRDSSVAGAGGRIVQGKEQVWSKVPSQREHYFSAIKGAVGNFNLIVPCPISVDHLQGTNMAFRRALLQYIGGWDEHLCGGYASFEEMDVCLTLRRAGFQLIFHPKATVVHGLNARADGITRELSSNTRYARSYARNLTYVGLKHGGWAPRNAIAVLLFAPLANIARCFVAYSVGVRRITINIRRLRAAMSICVGTMAGMQTTVRAKAVQRTSRWPRYTRLMAPF